MSIIDQVERRSRENQASALTEYQRILSRGDAPEPGDAERIAELAATIGLSEDDIRSDHYALHELRAAESLVLSTAERETLQKNCQQEVEAALSRLREQAKNYIDQCDRAQLQHFVSTMGHSTARSAEESADRHLLHAATVNCAAEAEHALRMALMPHEQALQRIAHLKAAHPRIVL
jgi:hypothetical protein